MLRVAWAVPGMLACAAGLHDWWYRAYHEGLEWPWWRQHATDKMRRCRRCCAFSTRQYGRDGERLGWRRVW